MALNSTSFNAARMVGPAIAGALIAIAGSGWIFIINAASFVAVLSSLSLFRSAELHPRRRAARRGSGLLEGSRHVWQRPDLKAVLTMLFLIGTFGLNFPVFIAMMSVKTFHRGASEYGVLTSVMAVGAVAGALLAARRANPDIALLMRPALTAGAELLPLSHTEGAGRFG